MTDKEDVSPAVRARQAACKHSFIKGASDRLPICVWCGLGKVEYENTHAQTFAATGWNGIP